MQSAFSIRTLKGPSNSFELPKVRVWEKVFEADRVRITVVYTRSWFSLNNSKTVKAVTLEFCSIQ